MTVKKKVDKMLSHFVTPPRYEYNISYYAHSCGSKTLNLGGFLW